MRAVIADAAATFTAPLAEAFAELGHEVVRVSSASAALDHANDHGAAFVLVGQEAALDVCRALRETAGDAARVIVVAAEEQVDAGAALAAGATDVWSPPPLDASALATRLAAAFHHARRDAGRITDAASARERRDGRTRSGAANRRSAFLAAASPLLDASLDLRATLESLARLTVPELADLCLVDVLEAGEVRRVACAAADAEVEELIRALPRSYVVEGPGDPVARVMRSAEAEILDGESAGVFGGWRGALADRLPRRAMVVPLTARGRTIGVLALATLQDDRRFGEEELALATDLARRAALAVDNARLFEQQSAVARVLQESLLPDRLPRLDGIDLAAAYRPAGDGTEIGGDFYDAFPSTGGGVSLAIGDVTGKGARAASLTGLTRHTLRTAAMYERDPSQILETLNRALLGQRNRRGKYCTVALARLERVNGSVAVEVACAGHPLPLVLRASGDVEAVGQPGTVLGFVPDPRLHDTPLRLGPGDALVLYTDGITEARTPTGLLGDERLAGLVREYAGLGAGAIAARLEHAAIASQQGTPRDDIAIAVARVRD